MNWSRLDFENSDRQRVGKKSVVKPSVWRLVHENEAYVIKDAATVVWPLRLLARYLLYRERKALSHLVGMHGVPQLVGMIDNNAFVATWIDGELFDKKGFLADTSGIALQFRLMTEAMHGRGVYHLDLRQRRNLLLTADSQLRIVDFGGAVILGLWGNFFLGRFFSWIDRQAVCKWLARYAPAELSLEDAQMIVRAYKWRRAWFLSPHKNGGELDNARQRIKQELT